MSHAKSLIALPSAWIPIAMSASALALLVGYLAIFGFPQQPAEDEGTAAHLFQLLMGGQVPIIAYFAIKYLPKKPMQTIQVLVLQFVAGLIPFILLFFFEH